MIHQCCLHTISAETGGRRTGRAGEGALPAETTEHQGSTQTCCHTLLLLKAESVAATIAGHVYLGNQMERSTALKSDLCIFLNEKPQKFCIIFNKKGVTFCNNIVALKKERNSG